MAILKLRPPQINGQTQDINILKEITSIHETSNIFNPTISDVIYHNDHSTVYRATFVNRDVVIKFSKRSHPVEDLQKEADVYQNELYDLQGICVPRFHGFFRGGSPDADSAAGCIILDYCGEALQELRTLPRSERVKITASAGKVHKAGIILRDFAPRNILRLGDRYTLIDFHHVRKHVCNWDGNLRAGKPIPSLPEMSCMNIANLCLDMDIWEPRWPVVDIGGYEFNNRGNYPDQEIVARLLPEKFENRRANREVLLEWLAGFRTLQEDDPNPPTVDEYKKTMPTLPIPYESQ